MIITTTEYAFIAFNNYVIMYNIFYFSSIVVEVRFHNLLVLFTFTCTCTARALTVKTSDWNTHFPQVHVMLVLMPCCFISVHKHTLPWRIKLLFIKLRAWTTDWSIIRQVLINFLDLFMCRFVYVCPWNIPNIKGLFWAQQ